MPAQTLDTPRGSIAIRPAVDADAPAVGELRMEALTRHPEAFGADVASHVDQSPAAWIDWLHRRAEVDSSTIQVADAGVSLIGMTGLYLGKSMKMQHNGYIWGVYVRPEWRGLRVGDGLIRACLRWAEEREARVAKLAVIVSNAAAIRCYLRCGFSVYGVEPRAIYHDGVYHDELLMACDLPASS